MMPDEYATDADADLAIPPPRFLPQRVTEIVAHVFSTIGAPWRPEPAPMPCIPGYEVITRLGRGGMGVVYQARHVRLDRIVALKMIRAGSDADPRELARFAAEAEAAARLHHPNIVQVFEIGEHDGCPFIALEYVEGGSLADHISHAPTTARRAAVLLQTLARAVHFAHALGIIHRDLKPANILLQFPSAWDSDVGLDSTLASRLDAAVPKITDFGLAKRLGVESGQTKSGELLGTPGYMAPEQAKGQAVVASDIFGLGAILYELLTGRPPFRGETACDTVQQALECEPVRPSRLRPRLPTDLETICLKCLQKDPKARFPDALALADDLSRFLSDMPIHARPTSRLEAAYRWCRRNRAVAALLMCVSALLLTMIVGASLAAWWWKTERDAADHHRGVAERAEKGAIQKLWDSYLSQARAGRWSGRVGQRTKSLEAIEEAARLRPSPELRNEAIACLALLDLRITQQWDGPSENGAAVLAFDANLSRYACGDENGVVTLYETGGTRELARLPGNGTRTRHALFSRDGNYIAVVAGRQSGFRVFDTGTLSVVIHESEAINNIALDFSPDSRHVAAGFGDGSIRIYDLSTGRESRRLSPGPPPHYLRYHPSGDRIAVCSATTRQLQVRYVEQDRPPLVIPHPQAVLCAAWSADGRLVGTGCEDFNGYVWDGATGKHRADLKGHQSEIVRVEFSPSGATMASVAWDGTIRLWDPFNGARRVSHSGAGWRSLQFDITGQRLGYAQNGTRIGLWDVCGGQEWHPMHGHQGAKGPWGGTFSPDGRILVTVGRDGAKLWDSVSGRELAQLPIGLTLGAYFRPDGAALLTTGNSGLVHWPYFQESAPDGDVIRIGVPRLDRTLTQVAFERAAMSSDARHLVGVCATTRGQAVLLDLIEKKRIASFSHPGLFSVGISPDGRWVATAARAGSVIRIWDASTGDERHTLPVSGGYLAFSPDGRWLAVGGGDAISLWKVGSWARGPTVAREGAVNSPAPLAFSPSGRLLAVAISRSNIHLIDPDEGNSVAELEAPDQVQLSALCFSSDASRLAAMSSNHVTHLWNLRSIRRALAPLGLDWDGSRDVAPETELSARVIVDSGATLFLRLSEPIHNRLSLPGP